METSEMSYDIEQPANKDKSVLKKWPICHNEGLTFKQITH